MKTLRKSAAVLFNQLELYEWVGLFVSLLVLVLFFAYANALDAKQGVPGWHWQPVQWIWAMYRKFLPKAFCYGLGALLLFGLVVHRNLMWGVRQMGRVIRVAVPFCVLLIIYRALDFYIPLWSPIDRDNWLLATDKWLFGTQPSLWLQPYITPHLTDLFSFFYSAWFPLIFITLVLMMLKSREAQVSYVTSVLFAFYIAYFLYTIVPAIGPVYTLQHVYTVTLRGGAITSFQKGVVMSSLAIARDCFPSLHTAISCLMVYFIGRHYKWLLWIYVPLGIGILCSTIYLRYHYFIDVVAGIVLAAAMCYLGPKWSAAWQRLRDRKRTVLPETDLPLSTSL